MMGTFRAGRTRSLGARLVAASMLALLSAGSSVAQSIYPENPEPGPSGAAVPGAPPPPANDLLARLGTGDFPKPYVKGLRIVGYLPQGGLQLGWIDNCAYLAGRARGITTIDVSNPKNPRAVGSLQGRAASQGGGEAFDALRAPSGRRVVIASTASSVPPTNAPPRAEPPSILDIFDASDCAHPKHVAEFQWPEGIHTVHLSPDGKRVYGMRIAPFTGNGGIHVLDISDMAHPHYLGKFGATGPDGRTWEFGTHNIIFSPDENRLYAGVIGSRGGDMNQDFVTPEGLFSPERVGREAGGVYILDSSDFPAGRPNPKLRLVGFAAGAGWHDVTHAKVDGVPHLISAAELALCPGAWPMITNIADEKHPRIVGQFRLDANRTENCPAGVPPVHQMLPPNTDWSSIVSKASSHYSSVDDPEHATLGLFNMTGAGFRVADIRNPARPTEIAYFRPGSACSGFSRYVPRTKQIWFNCISGFYVAELSPEARAKMQRPPAK